LGPFNQPVALGIGRRRKPPSVETTHKLWDSTNLQQNPSGSFARKEQRLRSEPARQRVYSQRLDRESRVVKHAFSMGKMLVVYLTNRVPIREHKLSLHRMGNRAYQLDVNISRSNCFVSLDCCKKNLHEEKRREKKGPVFHIIGLKAVCQLWTLVLSLQRRNTARTPVLHMINDCLQRRSAFLHLSQLKHLLRHIGLLLVE